MKSQYQIWVTLDMHGPKMHKEKIILLHIEGGLDLNMAPAVQNAPMLDINLDALMSDQIQLVAQGPTMQNVVSLEVDSFNLLVDSSGLELEEVAQVKLEPTLVLALPVEPINFLHLEIQLHELNEVDSQDSSSFSALSNADLAADSASHIALEGDQGAQNQINS
jgi:hypothetical protein